MHFDHVKMNELKHVAADRYQRNGCGGAHKVYDTCAAFDKSRGYGDMNAIEKIEYRARQTFFSTAEMLLAELAYRANGSQRFWDEFEANERKEADRYGIPFDGIPF